MDRRRGEGLQERSCGKVARSLNTALELALECELTVQKTAVVQVARVWGAHWKWSLARIFLDFSKEQCRVLSMFIGKNYTCGQKSGPGGLVDLWGSVSVDVKSMGVENLTGVVHPPDSCQLAPWLAPKGQVRQA